MKVRVFDTTLRDGEQSPGITFGPDDKIAIGHQLAALGVDIIEAGFPIASEGDFAAVQRVAREVQGPTIAGLARALPGDIDRAAEAVSDAEKRRIHVFMATSALHMKIKFGMTPDQVRVAIKEGVARAREHCDDIEFSPEDATRSDPDFVMEVCGLAVDAGATTINIADTCGFAMPADFGALIRRTMTEVVGDRDDIVVSAHCHNDLGMAVANSLAAIEAGARQIEGAINGIGERAGNTSIEEVVMALNVRSDHFGVETGVDTRELYATSQMVSELSGYPIQYNKAVVGRNAFAHESGIHQDGVIKERTTYEIMDPHAVGQEGSKIVLGKHSGRAALRQVFDRQGVEVDDEALSRAFARFKELADQGISVSDSDIVELGN
ncbi:MAG: 2-isopropylmalate synthase [Acidimicrobiia bacterium]|nr:2-isopropylmalate synthase [Acidimicrobiia bacterium]